MFPHIFQHWLTARSAASFKLPIVAHPLFILIVWVPCVLVGIWATTNLVPAQPPLPANPNAILPFLVATQAGSVLGGFLTAGILAAIMSSLDSQFLCLGTIFSTDIVNHYLGRDRYSDRQQILIARAFIVAIVAITYCLSLFDQPSVFAMGVWCFTGFASLFPLVFAALYWRRLTAAGAYASVLAVAAVWIYFFQDSYGPDGLDRAYAVVITVGEQQYKTMPVAWTFLAGLIPLIGVSLITRPPGEETLRRFFDDVQ
jgi:SSS family solute:Na+ symporter